MKPFDFEDSGLQEETQQAESIALLRRAYSQEQTLSRSEQQEAITRVERRLQKMVGKTPPMIEQVPFVAAGTFLQKSQNRFANQKPVIRVWGLLTAALLVGILIGSVALLFTQHMHSLAGKTGTSALAGPLGTPIVVNTEWDGLKMSMHVTSGPYFIGEFIAVDLSLTNRTHPALTLAGAVDPSPCGSALFPKQTGGKSPHYTLYTMPVLPIYACPAIGPENGPELLPGQTVAAHFFVVLASSSDVMLTGEVSFYLSKTSLQSSPGPLAGHLPQLLIHVASQVPANRVLSFQQEDARTVIHAPANIRLLDQNYLICQNSNGHPWASGTGHNLWEPLSTQVLHRPDCAGSGLTSVRWNYAIGAVGYEVVQGQQGKYSGPHVP